jgi:soluble lytic murein transglycosylase-like protein
MDECRPFSTEPATVTVEATAVATATPNLTEEVTDSQLGRWPWGVLQYKHIVLSAAEIYRIEPKLFLALIYIEGNNPPMCPDGPWTASCTSTEGAIGPAQVMPFHFPEGIDGRDPANNIPKGMEILRNYIDLAGGERKGLAFYNCGPAGFEDAPTLCLGYADKVLNEYNSR